MHSDRPAMPARSVPAEQGRSVRRRQVVRHGARRYALLVGAAMTVAALGVPVAAAADPPTEPPAAVSSTVPPDGSSAEPSPEAPAEPSAEPTAESPAQPTAESPAGRSAGPSAELSTVPPAESPTESSADPAAARLTVPTVERGALVPIMSCIVTNKNSYRAVFGYAYSGSRTVSIPRGAGNIMLPSDLDGLQPTTFEPGKHEGAFATPSLPRNSRVTWALLGSTANAMPGSRKCGPDVTLPTEGNGSGPVIVLLVTTLLSLAAAAIQARRQRADGRRPPMPV